MPCVSVPEIFSKTQNTRQKLHFFFVFFLQNIPSPSVPEKKQFYKTHSLVCFQANLTYKTNFKKELSTPHKILNKNFQQQAHGSSRKRHPMTKETEHLPREKILVQFLSSLNDVSVKNNVEGKFYFSLASIPNVLGGVLFRLIQLKKSDTISLKNLRRLCVFSEKL